MRYKIEDYSQFDRLKSIIFSPGDEILINVTKRQRFFLLHFLNRIENEQNQWADFAIGIMLANLIVKLPISIIGALFFPKLLLINRVRYIYNRKINFSVKRDLTVLVRVQ